MRLFAIGLCVAVLALGVAIGSAQDRKVDANQKLEYVVFGPYGLGELFAKSSSENRDSIERGGGPTTKEIVKALDKAKMFFLFPKKRDAQDGKWVFADSSESAALDGELRHELRDAEGNPFSIRVERTAIAGDHVVNFWKNGKPPNCEVIVSVSLDTSWYSTSGMPISKTAARGKNLSFIAAEFSCDIDGGIRWQRRVDKKTAK